MHHLMHMWTAAYPPPSMYMGTLFNVHQQGGHATVLCCDMCVHIFIYLNICVFVGRGGSDELKEGRVTGVRVHLRLQTHDAVDVCLQKKILQELGVWRRVAEECGAQQSLHYIHHHQKRKRTRTVPAFLGETLHGDTSTHTHIHTHTHMYTHICMKGIQVHVHPHMHTHVYVHAYTKQMDMH